MNQFTFCLNCIPTAQARVRYTSKNHIAYKSANQLRNERELESCLMIVKRECSNIIKFPIDGSLGMSICAVLPIPRSATKLERAKMLNGEIWPEKKPDIDNLVKQLLDAMTRMNFWNDDRQVVICNIMKQYGLISHWKVKLFSVRGIYGYRECV